MSYLTRDAILAAADFKYAEVKCPEWGGTVLVRSMTGAERDAFEAETVEQAGKQSKVNLKNVRARLVSRVLVSDRVESGGKSLFTKADVEELGQKSAAALDRVFEVAMALSGLTDQDVKELVTNFSKGPSDTSGSA